ncbi:hypothetical protein BCR32DRAFT_244169 [Anaeromyces robustus]|uniref:Uncharacterized protein n=1 Tax=Anaeromyces robustus TaxID=1754192 RepID=A0A1Y1X9L6_9FUNG|nr:hypothetical protein BCR32DRAFT_244169 [Anaeromyces robustus]|eukprot:ORX82428.1 hypothetical protein BCR32DRAFT_244169 [Anaeromyces robustus]
MNNPFSYIKKNSSVTTPSPLQTSFSLFSPISPLQPKVENFDIKDVKKDDLLVFNSYPYKVSEDLKKIFNNENNLMKNRGKLSVNNVSIIKDIIEKLNLLNDVSKCIVEPDWDIFQKAASIIQAQWRGYIKRKEFINKYLENPNHVKNIKFVKNYNYFNKKEPKYITKEELYNKIDFLTKHKRKQKSRASSIAITSPTTNAPTIITTSLPSSPTTPTTSNDMDDGADRFAKAAIKIQADFRGHYIRHYYKKYQNSNLQATKIQALW